MLTIYSYYKSELEKALRLRIEAEKDALVANSAMELSDYKFRVGVVHGLRAALDACEEVETEVNKR